MQVLLLSAIAGICGTGIGGIVAAVALRRPSDKIMCWFMMFASGVMTAIVCFGLVPEAMLLSSTFIAIVGIIVGIILIMLLSRLVDKMTSSANEDLETHVAREGVYHESALLQKRPVLIRSGMTMFAAISLHNIPEGMAIGAGGTYDLHLGALLTFMIALHNIPEGMAIAAPLIGSGMNKGKVMFITAMSGAPTLLGGAIGLWLGSISLLAIALSLAIAGGAMLYVVFGEMIPQSVVLTKSRAVTIVALVGLIVGLIIAQV